MYTCKQPLLLYSLLKYFIDAKADRNLKHIDEFGKAVIRIQAAFRGYLLRKYLMKLGEAATTIQAAYRGHRVRKITRRKFCFLLCFIFL